jgi:hypothetical protein
MLCLSVPAETQHGFYSRTAVHGLLLEQRVLLTPALATEPVVKPAAVVYPVIHTDLRHALHHRPKSRLPK